MGISDTQWYKPSEIRDMVEKGFLVAGTAPGTYKLTAAGIAKANREISSLGVLQKVLIGYRINANAEVDPKTMI